MKLKGLVLRSFLIMGVLVGGYQFKKIWGTQRRKTISLRVDHLFSKKIHDRLISFAREQEKITTSPALLSQIVKEQFPAVKKVKIKSSIDGNIRLVVAAQRPLVLINNDYILTRAGTLIRAHDIENEQVKRLPQLTIAQKDKGALYVSDECQRFIHHIENNLYNSYSVTWFDPSRIELQDKQTQHFTLLASNETVFSNTLFAQYEKLKEEVGCKPGTRKRWYVDVRFKNQIILFDQKGERG